MDLNSKINDMEKSGRDKFRKLCQNLNLEFIEATNQYEHYDGIIFFKGKKYLIEIKDRSNKFNYDTILFEDEKYQNIKAAIEETNADGAYYVSIWDNTLYLYYIPIEMNLKPFKIMGNKCTAINDEKREKIVYFIPKSETKIYTI